MFKQVYALLQIQRQNQLKQLLNSLVFLEEWSETWMN